MEEISHRVAKRIVWFFLKQERRTMVKRFGNVIIASSLLWIKRVGNIMADKTIHLKNSNGIYFKVIQKSNGGYEVRKKNGLGLLHTDEGSIGRVSSLPDAIDLVRAYSGKDIREIKDA